MSHLWDDDEDNLENHEKQDNYNGKELSQIDSAQLVAFESNKQKSIVNTTIRFAGALQSCEAIVVAAYQVADYVPPFQNDKQSDFWKKTVIPILMQSLQQDVKARSVITRSFGVVGDLAIVIQSVYEIVRRSRGSKKAIDIAKKNIPDALSKLKQCIALVEQLDSNAFANFAQQTETIFGIIGPESAKFAEQKEELDENIRKKCDKQQKLISELGEKKEKNIDKTEADSQEAEKRKSQLNALNAQIEEKIQNIPQSTQKTITENGRSGWWLWKRSRTKTHTVDVDNKDKESQHRYYNNVIKSRVERLQAAEKETDATKTAMDMLKKEISGYKDAYEKARTELQKSEEMFEKLMAEMQHDIDLDLAAKRELEKNALDTYERIGLQGSTLVTALVQVRTFARSLKPGASAYSPFAAVLNSIKALVESHVDLLTSDEASDIFLAGTLLAEQVKFLSDYTVSAQRIMKTTDEYDDKAITQKLQQQSITF
ncbi:uncharacterized protein LOC119072645 isoform X2 [Bradysia coprophila]|uniref:uncharacterized protein LOC119072645 isoform X2 n=1 Tax=Bradysia coprophila TaxID=38358 RepID=UPI00187DCDE4|nr:uncharacterized protein LOC119072645 isoform X2 [Bradysia coprophila]